MSGSIDQEPGQRVGVLGVVEDQQPPPPLPQRSRQPRHADLGRSLGRDEIQGPGQPGQLIGDQIRILSAHPPGDVVVIAVAVGILDRGRGLADPAHAVQGVQRRRPTAQQRLPQPSQQSSRGQ